MESLIDRSDRSYGDNQSTVSPQEQQLIKYIMRLTLLYNIPLTSTLPKSDTTYPDYREGYQVTYQETDTSNPIELADKEIYENPKAPYPQELPEHQ